MLRTRNSTSRPIMSLLASYVSTALNWTTPRKQIKLLLDNEDYHQWESFRDSLVSRWSIGNLACGFIMSAVSTILFSAFAISNAGFSFGVISLLSSLIAIGFGVGLTYVLVDVPGKSLHDIGYLHPKLYIYALSIPQIWASVSFIAFFASICVIVWDATNKWTNKWFVQIGVILGTAIFVWTSREFAFLSSDDSSESLQLNHTSTSDQVLPVDSSEVVQVNSVELEVNYNLLYWL